MNDVSRLQARISELEDDLRRARNEARNTSIESMQDVLARIGTALYAVDAESQEYSYFSPYYTELLGYTLDDVAEMGGRRAFLQHLIVDEDVEEKRHGFSRLNEGEEERRIREWRVWCRHKDGSLRYVEDHWIPAYEGGRLASTYGVLRDITSQKETEDALADTEGTYQALFDGIADPVLIFEKGSNLILDCNQAMLETFGYALNELQSMTPLDLVQPGERKDPAPVSIDNEDDTSAHTTIMLSRDGVEIPAEVHTSPVHYHGTDAWITIVRDITERMEAAARAERYTAEIESANEEIKQFAYIVSHDLRAPLVNLKGFSSELRVAMEDVLPLARKAMEALPESEQTAVRYAIEEDIPEALGFIDSSVTRMDGFINSVLKLSRIGRRELTFERLDIRPLVEEILRTLTHQQESGNATVTVEDLPTVCADRTAVEQIFGNLLSNALMYLSPDRPGAIEIGGVRRKRETEYWVRDNGRGIASDDAEKVFAPFRRAGKQDVPGEGMGLSYVHAMVRQHGGQIRFESELGVGTTFFFTIANDLGQ